jgi:hypothetical protein
MPNNIRRKNQEAAAEAAEAKKSRSFTAILP